MSELEEKGPKTGLPWMKIVLVVSLALNLLVVGALIGSRIGDKRDGRAEREVRNQIGFAVGPYGRALSNEDRRALREAAQSRISEFRGKRTEMRQLGARVVQALRAEPFDAAPIEALLEQQVSLGQNLQRDGQTLLLDRIKAMNPDARAAFADRLEEMLKRGKRSGPKP